MSCAERRLLLELLQGLRLRRRPVVAGAALAEELGVSLRTLYPRHRIAPAAQGRRGSSGKRRGSAMCRKPGRRLPPLMFSLEEVEALALGARWVEGRADEGLKKAARGAPAKIAAVLPPRTRRGARLANAVRRALVKSSLRGKARTSLLVRKALGEERKSRACLRGQGGAANRPVSSGRSPSAFSTMRACSPPGARRARHSAISAGRSDGGGLGPG